MEERKRWRDGGKEGGKKGEREGVNREESSELCQNVKPSISLT